MPASSSTDPPVDLRHAFRGVAASVWVITSAHDGVPVGFTAVSVTSVSLEPPLVSFNVSRVSSSLAVVTAARRYAAHLLPTDGESTARRFAASAAQRFADPTTWSWDDVGLPVLHGAAARLSGEVLSLVEAGDSLLAIGSVLTTETTGADPLLHHDRNYLAIPRHQLVGVPR